MVLIVDIDGVICTTVADAKYDRAQPIRDSIERVNRLHGAGHRIVLWTARGSETGIDWEAATLGQLNLWGVHYDELRFGKPYYDVWIDDKALNPTREPWPSTDI